MWPSQKTGEAASSLQVCVIVTERKAQQQRCSLQSPSVWMAPYLGLHTRGGEVCGCVWWETSACDMGALRGWGRKKWASLHLLCCTAPQCLLFLPEVPRVISAITCCQHEQCSSVNGNHTHIHYVYVTIWRIIILSQLAGTKVWMSNSLVGKPGKTRKMHSYNPNTYFWDYDRSWLCLRVSIRESREETRTCDLTPGGNFRVHKLEFIGKIITKESIC